MLLAMRLAFARHISIGQEAFTRTDAVDRLASSPSVLHGQRLGAAARDLALGAIGSPSLVEENQINQFGLPLTHSATQCSSREHGHSLAGTDHLF